MSRRLFWVTFAEPAHVGEVIEGWNKGNLFRIVFRWRNKHLLWQVAGWR